MCKAATEERRGATHARNIKPGNIRRLLHHVHIQPITHVPRDMAVQRPHPRVVRVELQHRVPGLPRRRVLRLHDLRVAALRVRGVVSPAPAALPFGQDPEVVAVEVHGVGGGGVVVEDYADGGVGAEVVDGPLRVEGVGDVALVCEEEDWFTVVWVSLVSWGVDFFFVFLYFFRLYREGKG